jgi:preprotein translocase subunit SecG
MQHILLIIHLILALCLIGVVLLQRSEGGGLGMGGGGGIVSSRGVTTALSKLTWAFAICFIATSITLTILAARNSADTSILDRLGTPSATAPATPDAPAAPALPSGSDLLPPTGSDTPATPPRAD